MSRLNPLWAAGRLNEALTRDDGKDCLELSPDGQIEASVNPLPKSGIWAKRIRLGYAAVEPIADPDDIAMGLRQLPPLLAFLSINPEPWCWTDIHLGSFESVGPFLDYVHPLWEWLVRAARAGCASVFPFRRHFAHSSPRRFNPHDEKRIPLPELVHQRTQDVPRWLQATLDDFELSRVHPNVKSAPDAVAVTAGLMEMHDCGEQSHELAQSVEGRGCLRAGDYWHAIHHRREPDPANAKYWLQKVGAHPIHETLATASRTLHSVSMISDRETDLDQALRGLTAKGGWDACAFVDLCTRAVTERNTDLAWVARKLQFLEMTLLLDSAHEDATT